MTDVCWSCGHDLRDGARFCDACGEPVAAGPGTEARKTVTVIFSDLVGSTALQESLDAESVRHVMGRFYAAMQAAIERHGGRVEKFVGDAVMGVFGVPAVREDDAVRAARAALDMVVALDALNVGLERDWGVQLGMRTGVNTGEVVVGASGFLVGDPINVAARLEQAAAAGQVLIGDTTARLVRGSFALEPLAPLTAKGKSDAVIVHQLVTAGQVAPVRADTRFVGRDSELAALRAVFDRAVAERTCRLATVIGSPGIGKTRLARELADELALDAFVVEGRCEPQGAGITFLPIADVLRDAAGIGESDTPDEVRSKLAGLLTGDPDAERIVERDAGVLGIVPPASAEETFWAVRRTLERLAHQRPLLVLLDDIHWGQPQFHDLIEHLVQWVSDAPMLVVALARPELRERHDALTHPGAVATAVVDLEPLGDHHSRALMSSLLEGAALPDPLVARLLDATGGNPLFLGETIRMLVEDGALRRRDDGTVEADAAGIDVPPTISALLAARIERLGADERSIVERAAVIGKQFYRGAVAELAPPPVASHVDDHLEALRLKEMVEPEGTYWIDEPVFRFHHVLIRDAAYKALLKEARSELHERFARWLEEKAGELVGEHEEVIAFHLEQAHEYRRELGPLDDHGRALGLQAAGRLGSAGRRALARDDLHAAANLLGRALDRLEPDAHATRAELLLDLAETTLAAGDTAGAADVVERLRAAAAGDPRLQARADVLAGQLATLTGAGDVPGRIAVLRAAADALAAAGDRVGEAKAHHVIAQTLALQGQVAEIEAALDRALSAAREAGDHRRVMGVLAAAPRAALWGPSPVVRASGRCLDVVRVLRMTPGSRHVEAVALRCQAVLEAMRGRTDAAREILAAGRATLEELGLELELHETAIHAATVELLAGDPVAAERYLRPAATGFDALGVDLGAAQAWALLARALVDQGRHAEAIAATEDAERRGGSDLKTTITWCGVRAEALARAGALDDALALAQRAVDLADPTDALPDKADAWMSLAIVHAVAGREDDARRAAAHARELYAAKDHGAGVLRATVVSGAPPAERPVAGAEAAIADPELRAFYERFAAGYAARDPAAILALHHPDYKLVDHRRLGFGEVHGLEGAERIMRTALGAAADLRFCIDEVIAAGDGAIAMRAAWRGTSSETRGAIELALGYVNELRDERLFRAELFEPDDEAGMRARFAELRRSRLPPQRCFDAWAARLAERDLPGLIDLLADDFVGIDHRGLAWERPDKTSMRAFLESMLSMTPDIHIHWDEILACDERAIAARLSHRGTNVEGGGPFQISWAVAARVEDGVMRSVDFYEHDDREAVLARYAELTAPPDGPVKRFWDEFSRRVAARDVERGLELYADDHVLVDHRRLGWDAEGKAGTRALFESMLDVAPELRFEVREYIADDGRVCAINVALYGMSADGGGEFVIPYGGVGIIENGQLKRAEQYEHDDRAAMIARYAELGGGLGALAGRPQERFWFEWARCFARRDLEAVMALYAADHRTVDHRAVGWGELDIDGMRALFLSAWAITEDVHLHVDEVLACDDCVIAMTISLRGTSAVAGGQSELSFGIVAVIEDGQLRRADHYEQDDRAVMLARYADLTAAPESPVERFWGEFSRLTAARDVEGLLALYADDHVRVDHRTLGWDTQSKDDTRSLLVSMLDAAPELRFDVDELIADDGRVFAFNIGLRGTSADTGGPFAIQYGGVGIIEDGQLVRAEQYEYDDRVAMIARFAELGGGLGALGDRPPERVWCDWARHFAHRDLDGCMSLYPPDHRTFDHRAVGWGDLDADAVRELFPGAWAVTQDVHLHVDEVLACDDRVIAMAISFRATNVDGGGRSEFSYGLVAVIEDGLMRVIHNHEHDDRGAMLARFAELTSERTRDV